MVKIKNDNISGELKANNAHFEMGRDIRKLIVDYGGIMPEDLPKHNKCLKDKESL